MSCPQCTGTDCQDACSRGHCYWEEMEAEHEREQRRLWEEEQMAWEHYHKHPHG